MAKFPEKSRRSSTKTHRFLCCFGFSGKASHFKTVKPDRQRKRPLFSWSPPVTEPTAGARKTSEVSSDRSRCVVSTGYEPPEKYQTVPAAITMLRASEVKSKPVKVKPGEVAEKIILKSTNPTREMAPRMFFPPPNPTHQDNPAGFCDADEKEKKHGSVVGMSIIVITLAITLLWGKLCSILCTAASFYIVTILRSGLQESDEIRGKVILGGFDGSQQENR